MSLIWRPQMPIVNKSSSDGYFRISSGSAQVQLHGFSASLGIARSVSDISGATAIDIAPALRIDHSGIETIYSSVPLYAVVLGDSLTYGYEDELGVLDATTLPYGVAWDSLEDAYYRVGHEVPVVQKRFKRVVCLGNPNFGGTVHKYLDPLNSALYEDGTDASADIAGASGYQVFVEVPKFYWKNYCEENLTYFWMGLLPFTGATTHPRFRKSGWSDSGDGTDSENEFDHAYLSAFEGVLYDASAAAYIDGVDSSDTTGLIDLAADKLCSVVGKKPWVGITRSESRTLIENGGGKIHSWHEHTLIRQCFLVEYASHNSQLAIPGYTEFGGGNYTDGAVYTGLSASLGNQSGSINGLASENGGTSTTSRVIANSYRGIENFFGHLWQWVDGVNVSEHQPYICGVENIFQDDVFLGAYEPALDGDGQPITQPDTNGFQDSIYPHFFVKSIGGSSATKITDYYYQSTGIRVLLSGGALGNGSSAGVGYLAAGNSSSSSNWTICAR